MTSEETDTFKNAGMTRLEYLTYFKIPWNKRYGRILYFKMIDWPQPYYVNDKIVPIAFLTITDR